MRSLHTNQSTMMQTKVRLWNVEEYHLMLETSKLVNCFHKFGNKI